MDLLNVVIVVGLIHCALFFFDTLFKNTGFQIEVLRVRWFTTAFNRLVQKWGTWHPKLLQCWFTMGSWFSLGLLPLATYLIIKASIDIWQTDSDGNGSKQTQAPVLEPMVPGINIPISDLGYYVITLITCSVVHEVGHAIAAVREDVHISGFGLVLVFFLPVAYVHLNTDQLQSLPPKRQLRILCAGIWHNVVLTVFAAVLLALLPLLFYPAYDSGSGVAVQNIQKGSPVMGPTGLQQGDRVIAVNQCEVLDSDSWYSCIVQAVKQQSPGYCISAELVKEHDESIPVRQLPGGAVECCGANSPDHLCFEYLETEEGTLELPQHSCLPGRIVVETADLMCNAARDCTSGLHCLKPSLENGTKLVRIERLDAKLVLFLGHPAEIFHTVLISDYVPLYFILSSAIPEMVTRMCKYITIFSAGLAVINVIPCYFFDGQYIVRALTDFLLGKKIPRKSVRRAIAVFVTVFGSFFLFLNCISIVLKLS
ncbi:membrane-bound transcription factor site-2 protease isoform X2 [Anabrus simplex]|uniref:membrane-bound transcription factor site-2 protease isoform X2 n=1 Tax=Anabrus simplex TaxID=316456 RepID=UPI0035A2948F